MKRSELFIGITIYWEESFDESACQISRDYRSQGFFPLPQGYGLKCGVCPHGRWHAVTGGNAYDLSEEERKYVLTVEEHAKVFLEKGYLDQIQIHNSCE